ncbi:MAG: tetratricopeptide repeat protein, partial [Promethearchaeota archaeon]
KNNERKEESSIVQQAAECLINVSKENKGDLAKHIEEIEPIGKWLFNIKNHKSLLSLVDDTLEEIEKQCYWTHLENLLTIGIKSAEKLNLIDKKSLYLYSFARILLHRGQYKKSEKLCKEALEIVRKKKNEKLEANILWHLGTTLRYMGKLDDVFLYIEQAEKLAGFINDNNILIKILITKGITEHGRGNFKKALELYDDSFKLFKSIEHGIVESHNLKDSNLIPPNKSEIIGMLKIRGSIGYQTNNFPLAKESWEMWLKMAEEEHAERDIKNANAKLSLINPAIDLGEMKQNFKELLDEFILAGEKASAITSYGELAEISIRRKEFDEAINLCNDALKNSQNINNLHTRSAKTYVRGIQAVAEGKLKKALKYLKVSEKLFAKWASPYRFWVADTFNRLNLS